MNSARENLQSFLADVKSRNPGEPEFIQAVQERQGLLVACPEEIAWRASWLDDDRLRARGEHLRKNPYGEYLLQILDERGSD